MIHKYYIVVIFYDASESVKFRNEFGFIFVRIGLSLVKVLGLFLWCHQWICVAFYLFIFPHHIIYVKVSMSKDGAMPKK